MSRRLLLFFSLTMPLLAGCLSFHAGAMPGEPEQATYANVEGTRVRYRDEGPVDGPPVVLIHGFASSLETWATVAPTLVRRGFRVLSLDLKGFGWTDRPPGDYSPTAQANLVLALMTERGIDRAAIVAHSYGSSVTLQMALQAPERVTRIALYDAWAYSSQLPAFFHAARADGLGEALFSAWYGERSEDKLALAFYDQRFVTLEFVEAVERAQRRPGTFAAALAAVRAMHYEAVEPRYHEILQPTLLLWGREDRVTPVAVAERLVRDLPRAELVVYPRCGHFPMIEAATGSTSELVRFLEGARDLAPSRMRVALEHASAADEELVEVDAPTPPTAGGDAPPTVLPDTAQGETETP